MLEPVFQDQGIEIWIRPVEPVYHGQYSYAVAFVSRRTDGAPYPYTIALEDLGMTHYIGYTIKVNVFATTVPLYYKCRVMMFVHDSYTRARRNSYLFICRRICLIKNRQNPSRIMPCQSLRLKFELILQVKQ